MIKKLDIIDKQYSKKIHDIDSKLFTSILYPFARIFNPQFIIIPIAFCFYCCLKDKKEILPLQKSDLLRVAPAITYVFCLVFNLALSLFLKKFWNRPRPTPPKKNAYKHKSGNLRGKEHNCSFPSGDSAQGAVFVVSFYFIASISKLIDVKLDLAFILLLTIFSITICFSRIYFLCHYIADTIAGVAICGSTTYLIFTYLYPLFKLICVEFALSNIKI